MCLDTTKTIHDCGCVIAEHEPGNWCLLGDQCKEIDHRHITTKRSKETCAKCLEAKEHKEEEAFLEQDGFTVVTKNAKSANTATTPKRPSFTHKQGIDIAETARKTLHDTLEDSWIVGRKNLDPLEYILGLPNFIPKPRLIETWVWWAVGREPYSRLRSARNVAARRNFANTFDVAMASAQNELQEEMEAKKAARKT
ncbi:uncharacterized protein PG986_000697 [Apiospora aurea]|uniref:Uncharacterized protein n=1 Tax=Apiospora aurea TaxID=335848 RepID=A0ABR1QWF8_9PEZI